VWRIYKVDGISDETIVMVSNKKKINMAPSWLLIAILALAIVVILFTGMFFKLAKKNPAGSYIMIGAEEMVRKAVDVPIFITSIPNRTSDTYEFEGRTYKMFAQFSKDYKGYNKFLAAHGCMATSMTTILRAYVPECASWTPYETIAVTEKKIAGEDAHSRNYNKKFYYQRPMSSYGATKVLDAYGIEHKYEKQLGSDEHLKSDLLNHLRKGKPIIFTVSRYNRETKKYSSKWTSSFHTMIMIGVDKKGDVLIGNPGSAQRFQLVDLDEMTNYMWSCTDEPNSFYWDNSKRCGGYIKIME